MLSTKRGRPAPELAYVEVDDSDRVRCTLCIQYNKRNYKGKFVLRASFRAHADHPHHLKSLELQQVEQSEKAGRTQTFATTQAISVDQFVPQRLESIPEAARALAEAEMWDSFDGVHELELSRGELHQEERRRFEAAIPNFGHWNTEEALPDAVEDLHNWIDENDEDDLLTELLEHVDDRENDDDVLDDEPQPGNQDSTAWYPYPSKLAFLLSTINNLPRLRISSSLMKVILWLLKEVGVQNVPSFNTFQKVQKKIKDQKVVPTVQWKSPKGNVYSFNDPCALVANDWSNPLTAKHLRRYPVIPKDGVVSEVWHAAKWRHDLERHIMSPMFDAGSGRHFFIDEPAALESHNLVIPVRWLEDEEGKVFFDAWEVTKNEQGISTIHDDHVVLVEAARLKYNMLDLEGLNIVPVWCPETVAKGHKSRMPNPDRKLAEGHPIYSCFIDVFGDDVSGNRSKSWNKHWNIYMTNRNLPRKLLQQQSNIHFLSSSTHAPVPEQFHGIKKAIEATHSNPIKTRCAVDGQETRVKLHCNCAPGDNPSQSETCGHIGGQGNFPCRKCKIGGTQKYKETDKGFESFFGPAEPRSSAEILKEVEGQVDIACLGVAQAVKDRQTDTGVKDAYTQHWIEDLIVRSREMQKKQPVAAVEAELKQWVVSNKDMIFNPFLTLGGFDVALDTPVEILHTILLGIVKYGWYGSHSLWNDTHKKNYSDRLQATNTKGLSIPPIKAGYIMQYANSLIGRQLKTLVQVNTFHVYGLVEDLQFRLTKAIGDLSALLWFPEIYNLEEYLSDVETAAANVLDIAALLDPSKIIAKIKNHLLAHLCADIRRFGPLIGVATETFECFNAIFRFCSILSNHLAPSRDIALQLAEQEVVKHFLSGGFWQSSNGSWTQSSPAVRDYFTRTPFLQVLLGYGRPTIAHAAGMITLEPHKRGSKGTKTTRPTLVLRDTQAGRALNVSEQFWSRDVEWYRGKKVISVAQDDCKVDSWVFARNPFDPASCCLLAASHLILTIELWQTLSPISGRILEILQDTTGTIGLVVLDVYQPLSERHHVFGMPVLTRRFGEEVIQVIKADTILFEFNVQHDCREAGCTASGSRRVHQERKESDLVANFVEHKKLDRYIINTHAFHNAHLLRRILPRNLTAPIPYADDRVTHHSNITSALRNSQDGKRAKTAEKRKATAATKRKADEEAGLGDSSASGKRQRQEAGNPDGPSDLAV